MSGRSERAMLAVTMASQPASAESMLPAMPRLDRQDQSLDFQRLAIVAFFCRELVIQNLTQNEPSIIPQTEVGWRNHQQLSLPSVSIARALCERPRRSFAPSALKMLWAGATRLSVKALSAARGRMN